jgi:hypothetical protein
MKVNILVSLALLVLMSAMFGLVYLGNSIANELGVQLTTYDCSIAEISPDYTTAMKEECRRLRMQQK